MSRNNLKLLLNRSPASIDCLLSALSFCSESEDKLWTVKMNFWKRMAGAWLLPSVPMLCLPAELQRHQCYIKWVHLLNFGLLLKLLNCFYIRPAANKREVSGKAKKRAKGKKKYKGGQNLSSRKVIFLLFLNQLIQSFNSIQFTTYFTLGQDLSLTNPSSKR